MSMTVLAIVQEALQQLGVPYPSSIISTTDPTQLLCKGLLTQGARKIRSKAVFPQQKRTHSFDLEASRYRYPLPRDFWTFVPDTIYDEDADQALTGPLSDGMFRYNSVVGSGASTVEYRVFGPDSNNNTDGGQFQVYPTPTASGLTVGFEYYSSNLFKPQNWQPSTAYTTADYVNANGLNLDCTTGGTSHASAVPDGAGTDGTVVWALYSTPYESIIANTDLTIFDDDLSIADFKWRYLRAKKKDYAEEKQEYMELLAPAIGRMNGSSIESFKPRTRRVRYNVPSGGWSF